MWKGVDVDVGNDSGGGRGFQRMVYEDEGFERLN